jgi:hypothetical protein
MRPVTGLSTEAGYPVHGPTTLRAIQHQIPETPLQVGLHSQELQAQHFRGDHDRIGAVESGRDRLVDEVVGLRRLLREGVDRAFEDVAFAHVRGGW